MRVVVALGGNALLRRGEPSDIETQRGNVRVAAGAVAEIAAGHAVAVTHGNGPQVGLLALQASAYRDVAAYPLDVLGAESEGMLGYLIEMALRNALPGREIVSVLTMVEVSADDPAFAAPTKPIGPVYTARDAERLRRAQGWAFASDGVGVRRVVPSPQPRRILETGIIAALMRQGVLPICAGGGGVPVVTGTGGALAGVEAVVDKDLSACLLAKEIGADFLLMLTDVDAVYAGWGGPEARPLGAVTPDELRAMQFEPGTMAPKVEAACRFAESTGAAAGIGRLSDAAAVLAGQAGTVVRLP